MNERIQLSHCESLDNLHPGHVATIVEIMLEAVQEKFGCLPGVDNEPRVIITFSQLTDEHRDMIKPLRTEIIGAWAPLPVWFPEQPGDLPFPTITMRYEWIT